MTDDKKYAAHINANDQTQSIQEHCTSVADTASGFSCTSLKNVLYDSGLLHDIGKYQKSFQDRIHGENIRVEHSAAGAIEAGRLFQMPSSLIMQYIIAGHHTGIPDGGFETDTSDEITLSGRLKRKFEDCSAYQKEIHLQPLDNKALLEWLMQDCRSNNDVIDKFAFIVRYCYSCLVDADSLDTEQFMTGMARTPLKSNFSRCLDRLDEQFGRFQCTSELQKARSGIQTQAYENIHKDADLYFMNMPTGSGKTLCSAKCALIKAMETGRKRIIYVIPYNSIISQTAEQFEKIFGDAAQLLRHQSTYSIDDASVSETYRVRFNQAIENWDADLIITTAAQFFETVFSNKRSRLRKLHNMADSVLIFDEAHLMPMEYMQPCLEAVSYLTRCCHSEAIFMTATMPDYRELFRSLACDNLRMVDLVPDRSDFHYFRRCRFENIGYISQNELAAGIRQNHSSLIVVNSRKKARRLYEELGGENRDDLFHLSTHMTKQDIQETIEDISRRLKNRQPVTAVSTSLIEAGVDLDFAAVYREYNGLDSILQAAGRCNREGILKEGVTYLFGFCSEAGHSDVRTGAAIEIIDEYEDIQSPEAIAEYYRRVYQMHSNDLKENAMHQFCSKLESIPFASYDGKIIQNEDVNIAVPENRDAEQLCEDVRQGRISYRLTRKLQKYTCCVHLKEFEKLRKQGVLQDYGTGIWILENMDFYSRKEGIRTEGIDEIV